jgi:hypothetical protein
MKKVSLVINNIYHVFNRGVNKNDIFLSEGDYKIFLLAAKHFTTKNTNFSYFKPSFNESELLASIPKVEILVYCLMPNHLLLEQKKSAQIKIL